jgi:hypothetical protein
MPQQEAIGYAPRDWPVDGPSKDEPWLKWPDESESDYARFQYYRDLPPPRRTIYNAFVVSNGGAYAGEDRPRKGGAPPSWQGLSRKWRWGERCRAFDLWKEKSQLEAERDGTLDAWREMGERHAREAMALQQKALQRLQTMNPQELSAAEVRQFLVQAATLERLARGASLQDMARVQREKEQEAAKDGYAVITYVDDWRGDENRSKRNQDSFYGNGQGALPTPIKEEASGPEPARPAKRAKSKGLPIVGPDGAAVETGRYPPLSVPPAAPRPGGGAAEPQAIHLPRRRKALAQDHPGDDRGGRGGDPG